MRARVCACVGMHACACVGAQALVVSPDKDLLQLVTEDGSITVYNVKKQQHVTYADAVEQFGVPPELIPQVGW